MLLEAKKLLENGVSTKRLEGLGLEFASMVNLLQNPKAKKDILERLYFDIWHFAKRQKTWWKKNEHIVWLEPNEVEKAYFLVADFLKK